MEAPMGIKLKDLAGVAVIVQLRMISTGGYYASVLEEGEVTGGSSLTGGILGRGATIDAAIADLLQGRERLRRR